MAVKTCPGFIGTQQELQIHKWACQSGYIRMVFALGEISRGMSLLLHVADKKLVLDCITIILNLKMYAKAAQLYEKIDDLERAAEFYIKGNSEINISQKMGYA
jgi:hypothetical protein